MGPEFPWSRSHRSETEMATERIFESWMDSWTGPEEAPQGAGEMGSSPSTPLGRRDCSTPIPTDQGLPPVPADPNDYRFSARYPDRLRLQQVEIVRVSLAPNQPINRVLDIGRKKSQAPFPIRLLVPG